MPTGKRVKTAAALNAVLFARRDGGPQPAPQPAPDGNIEVRGMQREIDDIADRMDENANMPINVRINPDVLQAVQEEKEAFFFHTDRFHILPRPGKSVQALLPPGLPETLLLRLCPPSF